MIERARRFFVLAALVATSCGGGKTEDVPVRADKDAIPTSASARASAAASASATPPSAEPSATPSESASAPASSAAPDPSASASARASSASPPLPQAPSGILLVGTADKMLKVGDKPVVKVLDPGDEPREKIVYALTKGTEQKVEMLLDMAVGMSTTEGEVPSTKWPRISMLMQLSVGEKDAAGDAAVAAKVAKVGIEPQGAAEEQLAGALRQALASANGLAVTYMLTPEGYVHDLKMSDEKLAGMEQGIRQSFESLLSKLPPSPIGQGARWLVTSRVDDAGADVIQIESYTLKKRDGSKLTLDVTLHQFAAQAAISSPALPPGASARLVSFKSEGGGDSEIDTKHVATDSGSVRVRTARELSVSQQGGPPGHMRGQMTMNVKYRRPR